MMPGSTTNGASHGYGEAVRALADVSASLVEPHDAVGTVTRLLTVAVRATGAAAGGITLGRPGSGEMELLAATSHRAQELELFQVQAFDGPCFQVVQTGEPVAAFGEGEIARRWPQLADPFAAAGYVAVQAMPLRWNGAGLGAVNLFWTRAPEAPAEHEDLMRAFADLATLAVVHSGGVSVEQVLARAQAALQERTLIEQAKGVLAHQRGLPMDAAFEALFALAGQDGGRLSETAARVVGEAGRD